MVILYLDFMYLYKLHELHEQNIYILISYSNTIDFHREWEYIYKKCKYKLRKSYVMFYVILMYMIFNILASVIQSNELRIFIKLLMVFAD